MKMCGKMVQFIVIKSYNFRIYVLIFEILMAHGMCTHESINFNSNALPYVMCRVRDEQRIQFEQT